MPISTPAARGAAVLLLLGVLAAPALRAQAPAETPDSSSLDGRDGRPLALQNFHPRPMLKVEQTLLTHAKFPVVDAHAHARYRLHGSTEMLDAYVKLMDKHHIAVCVSLDGRLGDELEAHKKYLWTKYRDRWVIFANIPWEESAEPDFVRRVTIALADAKRRGASGVKIFKRFGLEHKNSDGSLLEIDDPRWDPIWRACGELGLPILIHTADPSAFFLPINAENERWEELHRHPEWSFYGPEFPSREELLAARNRVIARHPETIFIGAHVASSSEDLATVGAWLDEYPNLYVDIAARIAELGRQPYTARAWFIKYADRILFGTDGPRVAERLTYHWRFLETRDEYFPYAEGDFPPQGLWRIYGLGLPDDVLKKVYYENAARLIPGVKERVEKYRAKKSHGERGASAP